MAKTISFANQKGGVGKTTSAINIASAIGISGKKILLIDCDPQGNATSGVGIRKSRIQATIYDVLIGRCHASDAIIQTEYKNLSIIPSGMDLAAAELELADVEKRQNRLKDPLSEVSDNYDYILIDCPPSMGLVTLNAFSACDTVIIPIQCEYYALEGLSQLTATIRQVKRLYNPVIELEGILLTMYDGRLRLTEQVEAEVRKHFPDKVYDTVIPRNVRLSEAPSFGMPAIYFDASSRGAKAYTALCKEFLKKNRAKKK